MTRNVQQLLTEHIDLWASAIENKSSAGRGNSRKKTLYGIKKLRELILELAVRGKLVEQNPDDEPASELLKRIAAERDRLVEIGKIKKPKKLPNIGQEEKPFELPKGWEWTILDNTSPFSLKDGDWIETKDQDIEGTVRLIQLADIGVNEFKNRSSKFINNETFSRLNCTEILKNDILIARLPDPIGRACIFPGLSQKAITVVDVAILRINMNLNRQFIVHALNSTTVRSQIETYGKGATRFRISTGNLKGISIPVPPLPEQHRIVAKVDELMTLCDQLEQQTEQQLDAHQLLVDTLLGTLTQSQNANELADNWTRLSQHFDTLFTTEASIDQLKQTILQLAVMGKLVPQNPNDEPASELLKRIAAEKEQLIKDKKIKKQKPLPPISDEEKPFKVPKGWEWVRLCDLSPEFQNGASSRGDKEGRQIIVLRLADIKNWQLSFEDTRSLKLNSNSIDRYTLEKDDFLIIRVNGSADIVGRFIHCKDNYNVIYCDHFIRLRFPNSSIAPSYLQLISSTSLVRRRISELFVSTAGQKTVNQKHISSLLLAIPPMNEQHRIVTKVNELLTLCDKLKERLQHNQQIQLQLTDTLVQEALV